MSYGYLAVGRMMSGFALACLLLLALSAGRSGAAVHAQTATECETVCDENGLCTTTCYDIPEGCAGDATCSNGCIATTTCTKGCNASGLPNCFRCTCATAAYDNKCHCRLLS